MTAHVLAGLAGTTAGLGDALTAAQLLGTVQGLLPRSPPPATRSNSASMIGPPPRRKGPSTHRPTRPRSPPARRAPGRTRSPPGRLWQRAPLVSVSPPLY